MRGKYGGSWHVAYAEPAERASGGWSDLHFKEPWSLRPVTFRSRHPRAGGDPVRRGLSVLSLTSLEYWVTRLRGDDTEYVFSFSRRNAPELCQKFLTLSIQRAQGMPGARCTRGLVCNGSRRMRTRAYRAAESIRHSLRNGFTAYYVISPVSHVLLPPSTPTSGRQDHTSLPYASAPFVDSTSTSTATRPNVVTSPTPL